MKIAAIMLVFILALAGGKCAVAKSSEENSGPQGEGTVIETAIGDVFSINLDSNITTGYSWRISRIVPAGIIELLDSQYLPPEQPRLGAGGTEVWHFQALTAGDALLSLEYVRPWEKDASPVKTADYRVRVQAEDTPLSERPGLRPNGDIP